MKQFSAPVITKTLLTAAVITASFSSFAATDNAGLDELIAAAKKEGVVYSVGMPDAWANWKGTWADIEKLYGLKHQDTDMSSAQEIAKFAAEKNNATADIGDVGASFGPVAVQKGVVLPYKPTTWDQIPDWAKDKDGNWALAYTGTIAFIINNDLVKDQPKSWADLQNGKYRVTIGDVGIAAQANSGVLAAAFALGGNETNIQPAIDMFAELAKQKRLSLNDPSVANLEKGEIEVAVMWDFNALSYRDQIDAKRFTVVIPSDGSVTSGYSTIINKFAKNPNAAKLTREFIFSDKGQLNLAEGYARPIRAAHLTLPESIKAKLLPESQYAGAKPITDFDGWEKTSRQLPKLWQQNVIINMN